MAAVDPHPMGVVAVSDGKPVGWVACGPRSRYLSALAGRSSLLAERPRDEDAGVWLIACIFVRPESRSAGIVVPMLRAAVSVARDDGAFAVEAWPLGLGVRKAAEAHVGREVVFARLGFTCIQRPSAERAIMRLKLSKPDTS